MLALLASENSLVLEASIIYYFCLCLEKGGKKIEIGLTNSLFASIPVDIVLQNDVFTII